MIQKRPEAQYAMVRSTEGTRSEMMPSCAACQARYPVTLGLRIKM